MNCYSCCSVCATDVLHTACWREKNTSSTSRQTPTVSFEHTLMFSLDSLFVTYKHTDASDDRHTLMRRADVGTDRLSQQIVPLRGCRGVWGRGLRRTALYQFHYCGFSHSLLNKQHTSDVVSVCMLFCRRTINDQIPWVPVECSWTESKSHHRKQIYALKLYLFCFILLSYLCWQSFMLFIYFLLYFYFSIQCHFSFFILLL